MNSKPIKIPTNAEESEDLAADLALRHDQIHPVLETSEIDRRRPIAAAKSLINQVSLPSADRLLEALNSFTTALTWPEAQQRFQALFKRGLNRPGEMENRFAELLPTLIDTQG